MNVQKLSHIGRARLLYNAILLVLAIQAFQIVDHPSLLAHAQDIAGQGDGGSEPTDQGIE